MTSASYTLVDSDEEIFFLEYEDVVYCHAEALKLHPHNLHGLRNSDALESAIDRPRQHLYYEGQRDLLWLAAIVWHGVGRAHGFNDGNKRTAFNCAFAFLEANGIEIVAHYEGEPGHFVEALFEQDEHGKDSFEIPQLENYLRMRYRWIQEE